MSRQNISQKYSKKGIDYYLAITLGLRVGVAPCRDNLRCARSSRIYMPNPNFLAIIVSEISQTNMARSTRLVILIKNIYTSWGRKRFLLTVTYFQTNVVYPFTLRVTGITNGLRTGKEYFF